MRREIYSSKAVLPMERIAGGLFRLVVGSVDE